MTVSSSDAVKLHRLLLMPFREAVDSRCALHALDEGLILGEDVFLKLLQWHGLDALWYEVLHRFEIQAATPPSSLNALKQARRVAVARYMIQRKLLERIDAAFEKAAVRYAVFKGVHVRELIYEDPALRQASDMDILVSRCQRNLAAQTLINQGFHLFPDPEVISHEASFHVNSVTVDLHWDIMRPGRTRTTLTDLFLQRRSRESFFWGLDPSDTLFILLVHPAFTKYVSSPYALLCRLLDLKLWLKNREIDWGRVLSLLDESGLKTAAWLVLYRLCSVMDSMVPNEIEKRLKPGYGRARYLRYWVDQDLVSRWIKYPSIIQLAFTLFLHDRPTDALVAIQGWLRHKWSMRNEQASLLKALENRLSDAAY